jgi:hypothetical protein
VKLLDGRDTVLSLTSSNTKESQVGRIRLLKDVSCAGIQTGKINVKKIIKETRKGQTPVK